MASTITDVSKYAGCSPATVSRVLNNSGPVSAKTREAVLRSAKQLGYFGSAKTRDRRRALPRAVAGRTAEVVLHWKDEIEAIAFGSGEAGVEVSGLEPFEQRAYFAPKYQLSNSFHRGLINGLIGELNRWDIKAVVQVARDLTADEFLRDLNAPGTLGVLLLGEPGGAIAEFCDNCTHPLVLVDILHQGWPGVVTIDNVGGAQSAVNHLIELGHRDLGFIGWTPNPSFSERRAGFVAAVTAKGLDFHPEWCCEQTVHIEEKADEIAAMLSKPSRPTALVCSNDYQALSAIRAANRVGLRVPHDISVVGFDDTELAHFTTPALTTVRVPVDQLGRAAVRQLILSNEASVAGETLSLSGCDVRVRTELIVRESTRRLD